MCLEIRNLGRIFLLDALDCLVSVILHYPLLFEVFDPSFRTRPLKLRQFLPALTPRLIIFFDRVDDVAFVQTGEEQIPAFPALFARAPVGGYAAAVGGFGGVVGGPREPAHFDQGIIDEI